MALIKGSNNYGSSVFPNVALMKPINNMQPHALRIRGVLGDIVAFMIPCIIFMEINIVGRLFVPEIILAVLFIFLFKSRGRALLHVLPRTFILLVLIWLLSQILTDIIRSTPFEDYMRGWSKIIFLLLNFSAIYLLLHNKKRRFLLFAVGIAIGQILQYVISPNIYVAEGYVWKFGFGYAVTFLLILSTQWKKIAQIPFLPEMIAGAAAILNFFLGTRSLGATCFATVLYLFYLRRFRLRKIPIKSIISAKTLIGILLMGCLAMVIIGGLYGYAASAGWFGENERQKYEWQASGKFGFLLGGRSEILVSSLAIMDSPIIGHGSWAKDPQYSMLLLEQMSEYGYETRRGSNDDLIPTHSYLLGAWVESGISGAVFWFWVLLLSIKLLIIMRQFKSQLTVLLVFVAFGMIWKILFSPFGAENRIYAAYYIVLLMYGITIARNAQVLPYLIKKIQYV